ncbi:hypothetical protein PCASD_08676 [Puccinia coronata f. sp. avenae]|uniref:Uncharacterized protein n=1 Tax=Puccinia coronata f. sp. avenae TaxID=200324 RepID=A0A2N5V7F2_9BASI|nr:hypothetical protein PCASD_16779 [Puccinia coronata f. sp. avenae]PLW26133.1 hypothetical protein PCASD_24689 [Puccinia coronata f. sp. avenae]PLW45920.1 hypothetical protein PCASD_08676 [Puccinia coronata f. sp. avenae]
MRLQFASQIIINPASRSSLSRALPGHLSEVHLSKSATKKECREFRIFPSRYLSSSSHISSVLPHLRSGYHRLHRAYFEAQSAAYLRLVCRAWADWLYEHHLYRTLTFDSALRSLAF